MARRGRRRQPGHRGAPTGRARGRGCPPASAAACARASPPCACGARASPPCACGDRASPPCACGASRFCSLRCSLRSRFCSLRCRLNSRFCSLRLWRSSRLKAVVLAARRQGLWLGFGGGGQEGDVGVGVGVGVGLRHHCPGGGARDLGKRVGGCRMNEPPPRDFDCVGQTARASPAGREGDQLFIALGR